MTVGIFERIGGIINEYCFSCGDTYRLLPYNTVVRL